MKIASPYIIMENCREAVVFYQNILGGEIKILNEQDGKVTSARLMLGNTFIQFGDTMGRPVAKGENVRIYLQFEDEDEIRKAYNALKVEGKVEFELKPAFFGALLAALTDKNGVTWNMTCFTAK